MSFVRMVPVNTVDEPDTKGARADTLIANARATPSTPTMDHDRLLSASSWMAASGAFSFWVQLLEAIFNPGSAIGDCVPKAKQHC